MQWQTQMQVLPFVYVLQNIVQGEAKELIRYKSDWALHIKQPWTTWPPLQEVPDKFRCSPSRHVTLVHWIDNAWLHNYVTWLLIP